ncbi:RHS repeat-associated core domain-containing protein [Pseudomonas sp. R5(2019)]|uniref:RHS repeat-associated core domain-containing protein n=1 Tax=Pseudomonas sp. R5(2019) TaxID=2697566 RepID=UPI0014129DCF|nr:RHS repeat-associated core domain-containing protein [Pseudomonas sp. R5(2019)]NBA96400.1 hypothetical protein [Pseudomonas sp. R5(2019)]
MVVSKRLQQASQAVLLAVDQQRTPLSEASNRLVFTPYGERSAPCPPQILLGFNGLLREAASGAYLLGNGHRAYNPALMRFHSPDALSPFRQGGVNAYAYCLGDPVNAWDPSGKFHVRYFPRVPITAPLTTLAPLTAQSVVSYVQQGFSVALNIFSFLAGVATASATPPPSGLSLAAARLGVLGPTLSAIGGAMQLGGVPQGVYVSMAANTVSTAGAALRMVGAWRKVDGAMEMARRVRGGVVRLTGWNNPYPRDIGTSV